MARRYYNGAVRNLNIGIQSFPRRAAGAPARLPEEPFFELDDRAAGGRPAGRISGRQAMTAPLASRSRSFCSLAALGAARGAVERILRFHQRRDGRAQRRSRRSPRRSRVQAEGREIRRGILRDFPDQLSPRATAAGSRSASRCCRSRATAAPRTSRPSAWRTACACASAAPTALLNTGRHDYVIIYRTTRQIGFFADFDELYWNATGTGWTFPIDLAEARITLPEAVPFRQTAVYTGPQDAQGRDATVVEQRPGRIVFRTTRPLPAAQRPDGRGGLAEGRRDAAERRRNRRAGGSRTMRRAGRGSWASRWCLAIYCFAWRRGRARSAARHDHPAVRARRRHVGGRGALRRQHGLRPALLHGRDRRSRRERASQDHGRR